MDARAFESGDGTRGSKRLTCCSHAERAARRNGGAAPFAPRCSSRRWPAIPRPARRRAAADLQRVFERRRRNRAARLRELRTRGGLRGAGPPRHFRQGAIAIVRYGSTWRGNKPKIAAEHGAVGCLIYSDPKDDGYGDASGVSGRADAKQGWCPAGQRDGHAATSRRPADAGRRRGAGARIDSRIADAATITKIPVLPISYGDAQPLLEAMSGPVCAGGLARRAADHLSPRERARAGASEGRVELGDQAALRRGREDPGSTYPDEWVIRGNHHDAWVNGASDPISGMAPSSRKRGRSVSCSRQGWRPKRTIVYAAWDGEEPALLGSTEWVEQHESELQESRRLHQQRRQRARLSQR